MHVEAVPLTIATDRPREEGREKVYAGLLERELA
jgi:hypothetical protein